MSFKVALPFDLGNIEEEKRALAKIGAELVKVEWENEDGLIAGCRDAHAVLVGPNVPMTRKVISNMGECKIISRVGIGYNNIDVQAATEMGIPVSIVPDYCVQEVSDHALAFILTFVRGIFSLNKVVRQGAWELTGTEKERQTMRRLEGKTMGILGFGRIGRALASKAQAFGMRVIACDPYVSPPEAQKTGAELVAFETMLEQSDFISLHAALTDQTRHLFSLPQFKKMKRNAFIVNCARGPIIDEEALITALSEGYIAGAGLDVLETEPPRTDSPLLKFDNVFITTHLSWYSEASVVELRRRVVESVIDVLTGGWPRVVVNPQVKPGA